MKSFRIQWAETKNLWIRGSHKALSSIVPALFLIVVGWIITKLLDGQFTWAALSQRPITDWFWWSILLLALLSTAWLWIRKHHVRLTREARFKLMKPASQLTPGDLHFKRVGPQDRQSFDRRPFIDQYVPRSIVPEDGVGSPWGEEELADAITSGKGIVLLGEPTDGKTRTLYDVVCRLLDHHLVAPIIDQPTPEPDAFKILAGRSVILMLDNLTDFVDASVDLTTFCDRLGNVADYVVVATCRDGPEQGKVRDTFTGGLRSLYEHIPLKLRLEPLNADDKQELAESAGIDWDPAQAALYPTPGSIVMAEALSAMTERFNELSIGPRSVVLALTLLDHAGIVPATRKRVKSTVRDVFGQTVNLDDCLSQLAASSFIEKPANRDPILPEPAYVRPPVVNYDKHRSGGPRGDFDALAKVLRAQSDIDGLFSLGSTLLGNTTQDHLDAVKYFDKALEIDLNAPHVLNNRGVALGNLGRNEDALVAFDAALRLWRDSTLLFNKGTALGNLGRNEDAIAVFDTALDLRPKYTEAMIGKGAALGRLGLYEEAIAVFNAVLDLRPEYPEALTNKGMALRDLGCYEEEIAAYDAAFALRQDPMILNNKGLALRNLGRHEEEIAAYDAALQLRPEYPEVLVNKGVTLGNLGRYKDAIAAYDAALEMRSDYPEALIDKGVALNNLGCHQEAIATFNMALALRKDPEAFNNMGVALDDLGRFEDAVAAYDMALALRSNYPEALNNRGVTQRNLGSHRDALASYDMALALRPEYTDALNNKGASLIALGRHKDAIVCFDKLLVLRPDMLQVLCAKAFVFELMGRFDDANACYATAAELGFDCERGDDDLSSSSVPTHR